MNYAPKFDRRSFVIGAAAVGGGLALGLRLPFGPDIVRAADGSPEVNAWVVIRPDDTVVIRIARSEMGQGSLTGLAQLVAESWNATDQGHHRISDPRPEPRAQARLWRHVDRAAAAASARRTNMSARPAPPPHHVDPSRRQ